jgi:hypothetical protein
VRGVHSPRAKRFVLNRLAEQSGVTTVAPLLQMLGKRRDVRVRVHLAEAGRESERQDDERCVELRARLVDAIGQASLRA